MEDHRTLENILKLLKMLASPVKRYTPNEIADRLDVSSRTAYRYLLTLKDVGFGVLCDEGAYYIPKVDDTYRDISQLVHFSLEEETLVYNIMQKLSPDAVNQRKLKAKMATVFNLDNLVKSVTESRAHSDLAKLVAAINGKKQVCLRRYHSGNSGKVADKVVEPFSLVENYSILWAYEPASKMNKIFKLSRVSSVDVLDKCWECEDSHKEEKPDVFRSYGRKHIPVNLEFDLLVYNLLVEEYPATKSLVKKSAGNYSLKVKVCRLDPVTRFVLGLIDHIDIVDSPELEDAIQQRIGAFKK